MNYETPVVLFLFAHQDDEFGIFQKIVDETKGGRVIYCVYLTDGGFRGISSQRRNNESLDVLLRLGVKKENIFFIGEKLFISDGTLPKHIKSCSEWLQEWISGFQNIKAIYIPAWEGGHQDHDALHAIIVGIASRMGILTKVWQFPLYHSYRCYSYFFRVFSPLAKNGPITKTKISLLNRVLFLKYCLSYPSQKKTWLGLFPFVMLHYMLQGVQILQPVSKKRIFQLPHKKVLLYEKRGFFTWEEMRKCLLDLNFN